MVKYFLKKGKYVLKRLQVLKRATGFSGESANMKHKVQYHHQHTLQSGILLLVKEIDVLPVPGNNGAESLKHLFSPVHEKEEGLIKH